MKLPILPVVLLAAAGLATACGGSSNSSSDTSTAAASTPASASSNASGAYGNAPASTPASGASGATSIKVTKGGDLGSFLTNSQGRAIYLWEADKSDSSTCSGACAQAWPPVTTSGAPMAGSGVKASLLGTTKRSDGSTEVTYAGHPLYYFVGDKAPGDTAGQGSDEFGADWLVVAPTGKAIEKGDSD